MRPVRPPGRRGDRRVTATASTRAGAASRTVTSTGPAVVGSAIGSTRSQVERVARWRAARVLAGRS
jgi:hypothetical protein